MGNVTQTRMTLQVPNSVVLGIYKVHFSLIAVPHKIIVQPPSDLGNITGCSNNCDRFRFKQVLKIHSMLPLFRCDGFVKVQFPFDKPFDKLTVLSKVEGLTALSEVEGLRCASSFVTAAYC